MLKFDLNFNSPSASLFRPGFFMRSGSCTIRRSHVAQYAWTWSFRSDFKCFFLAVDVNATLWLQSCQVGTTKARSKHKCSNWIPLSGSVRWTRVGQEKRHQTNFLFPNEHFSSNENLFGGQSTIKRKEGTKRLDNTVPTKLKTQNGTRIVAEKKRKIDARAQTRFRCGFNALLSLWII